MDIKLYIETNYGYEELTHLSEVRERLIKDYGYVIEVKTGLNTKTSLILEGCFFKNKVVGGYGEFYFKKINKKENFEFRFKGEVVKVNNSEYNNKYIIKILEKVRRG